jgi:hypothetical protein
MPFLIEVLMITSFPPFEIIGREFHRIAMELRRLNNGYQGETLLPLDAIPFREPPASWDSRSQPTTYANPCDRELDFRVVYVMLRSILTPFFKDVLLNTLHPPLLILVEEFTRLSNNMLRLDNAFRDDGQSQSYLLVPFPSGEFPASTALPPLLNMQSILDLRGHEILMYYRHYYPNSSFHPGTIEETRKAVASAIGVTLPGRSQSSKDS